MIVGLCGDEHLTRRHKELDKDSRRPIGVKEFSTGHKNSSSVKDNYEDLLWLKLNQSSASAAAIKQNCFD